MKRHHLKTWPGPFSEMAFDRKTFEFRKNDRGFKVGDVLILKAWDPERGQYTGEHLTRVVTYLLKGGQFGMPDGYCCMSLRHATRDERGGHLPEESEASHD